MMPRDVSRDPAMMIVGGAAVLVGAVVGGKGGPPSRSGEACSASLGCGTI